MMNLKKWHLEKYQELRYIRNKFLEMKSQQVFNNRVINSALIEPLRFRENLTSIGHLNGQKNMHNSKRTDIPMC